MSTEAYISSGTGKAKDKTSRQAPRGKLGQVQVSDHLAKDIRDMIDGAFRDALLQIGEEELNYISRTFDRKAKAVELSQIPWVRDLVAQLRNLQLLYEEGWLGRRRFPEEVLAIVGAVLFYFVNPYDIIPDHVPGRGYLDDAYVYNQGVKMLGKIAPELLDPRSR